MANIGSSCMKVIEELETGREYAKQLRDMMNGNDEEEEVVKKVLMSFTNSLLLLNNNPTSEIDNPAKSEDSQESNCKTFINKERRGCYKRRRNSQTREHESETPIEDGHQWRKYGQKVILNSKYPRNYYRCTHKYDQNCQATKQVQRVEDNPPLHKTTYYGNHTCRNLINPDIILDDSNSHPSVLLRFDNSLPTAAKLQDCPFISLTKVVKKECKEDIIVPSSSSNDYILSPELTFDNSSNSKIHSDYMDEMSSVFYDSAGFDQLPLSPFFNFDE
ncbi:hypothetical protein TanjilG_12917 [Lupinus angustifolius]|uniref:WRKY domain-containing protein n=1 Tax=Lupinus angustifolius TaxID=3871 RepID=A0A1J7HG74_LUPAN|nr:PREDICTED: probable WRKY transcription factor 70 [Lupinus angustifolius]OIW01377.1 hypothetical protein TanjilG_12917 [Lupinus angustifolius]